MGRLVMFWQDEVRQPGSPWQGLFKFLVDVTWDCGVAVPAPLVQSSGGGDVHLGDTHISARGCPCMRQGMLAKVAKGGVRRVWHCTL